MSDILDKKFLLFVKVGSPGSVSDPESENIFRVLIFGTISLQELGLFWLVSELELCYGFLPIFLNLILVKNLLRPLFDYDCIVHILYNW